MKQIIVAVAFLGIMLVSAAASAHPRHKNSKKTQYNQQQRIQQGARSGQLTKGETRQLRMQQAKIRHYKQMAKADGRVNRRERQLINREQMYANRSIYQQKHDGQRRNDGQMRQYRHSR